MKTKEITIEMFKENELTKKNLKTILGGSGGNNGGGNTQATGSGNGGGAGNDLPPIIVPSKS